jgi:hypothetical protein
MDDAQSGRKVTRYRVTAAIAEKRIRQIAGDSDNIKWSLHALQRMEEREIFDIAVLRVLRAGTISGNPEETPREGEWKCKMVRRIRGAREAGVVAILLRREFLLIKTVEWEDLPCTRFQVFGFWAMRRLRIPSVTQAAALTMSG